MRSATNQTRAFTLLELLVVLGVILLLTALLFPARAKTASNVKSTGCLANLKLWASATQMYAAENSDSIPRDGTGQNGQWPGNAGGPDDLTAWINLLPQYIKEQPWTSFYHTPGSDPRVTFPFPGNNLSKIWMCPAAEMNQSAYNVLSGGGADGFFSYDFNLDLKSGYNYPLMPRLVRLPNPSATVLMYDCAFNPLTELVNASPQFNSVSPANRWKSVSVRHNIGAVLAFCDGHVEYFRTSYITNNDAGASEPQRPDIIWNPVTRAANP